MIKRWIWLSRKGLPDIGYPHQSPEQSLAGDYSSNNYIVLPEDEDTARVMSKIRPDIKEVARLLWGQGLKVSKIAKRLNMSRSKVRYRIEFIKQKVADQVIL
ncbi:MAG: hypothetical protein COB23_03130 [Methylophaga sp.]|nr:MAG: hypothetical protein COB23_03130 [Methylophaga sp.]